MVKIPLAERLRPQSLTQIKGQPDLLAKGKPLRCMLETGQLHSMILWGPPGVGKTTLAHLIAQAGDAYFLTFSAVLSGIKEIREAVTTAQTQKQYHRQTVVFVDEVHRFNKAQQDAFLPHIESGLLIFIGATTENPSFEVNRALLSRTTVYQLKPLAQDALQAILDAAAHTEGFVISEKASALLIHSADGDARRLLNNLEAVCFYLHSGASSSQQVLDEATVRSSLPQQTRQFDRNDIFYDQISALHKSVRGSAPDAALYWLSTLLDGGVDPHYLMRRIVRMAWEDIGLADPRAAQITLNACATYRQLGSPEGELALAQAVIYLAVAAKSNAAYLAYQQAARFVRHHQSGPVPMHLRNAPTKLMKSLGYGAHYRYAHDEPDAYAARENYWPENISQQSWYQPTNRGLEIKIAQKLAFLKTRDEKEKADQ